MNTRFLMIASAMFMLVCGVLLQFIPHEILERTGSPSSGSGPLFLQLAGALFLGFAFTNWMAKGVLIGGIYARPLAVGNFAHFLIGALALVKYAFATEQNFAVWALAAVYTVFAIAFGYVFFTNPAKKSAAAD